MSRLVPGSPGRRRARARRCSRPWPPSGPGWIQQDSGGAIALGGGLAGDAEGTGNFGLGVAFGYRVGAVLVGAS